MSFQIGLRVAAFAALASVACIALGQTNCEPAQFFGITERKVENPPWGASHFVDIEHNGALWMTVRWRGSERTFSPSSNPVSIAVDKTCLFAAEQLEIEAIKTCEQPAKTSVTVSPGPPEISIDAVKGPPGYDQSAIVVWWQAKYAWNLRLTGDLVAEGRQIRNKTDFGTITEGETGVNTTADMEGPVVITFTACDGLTDEKVVPLLQLECDKQCDTNKCDEMPQCVGHPVHTFSGNMRYEEVDPLPSNAFLPLRRTYLSRLYTGGFFGTRWYSMFDASLFPYVAADGTRYVSVRTEDRGSIVFSDRSGSFVQIGPGGRQHGKLTQSVDGTWTQTDADGRLQRVFDAQGLPIAFRDVSSAREVRLTWSAGLPVRVEDSWGNWAWNVTADATTRRITSIAVDGRPDLVWTYVYDQHLSRVDSPAGTWRSYEYAGGTTSDPAAWHRLATVKDGNGRILETHAYERFNTGRALTSNGPGEDVDSILVRQPGRSSNEFSSTIHYTTGRTEKHYRRWIAGAWRTVEVDGGCSSCGSRYSAAVYDQYGNVIRAQEPHGYIVEKTYDAVGRNIVRTVTALRPDSCDPQTAGDHCRLTTDALAAAELIPTAATVETTYHYDDAHWPQRPTSIETASTMDATRTRVETMSYDAATGEVLVRSTRGWTGNPVREETRTTTTTLYDGTEGAAFPPGGAFEAAWLTLPQPRMRKSVDGPRTDVADLTRFVYYPLDPAVPATWRGRLAATRNPAGHMERYEDYDAYGNARRVIDANGVVRQQTYDSLGRLLTTTVLAVAGCDAQADPLCNVDVTATRTYSGAGPLASETRPGGGVTAYEYDSRGRVSAVTRGPSAANRQERMEIQYDPATDKKSLERWFSWQSGSWVERKRQSYAYDVQAQLQQVTHADGASLAYAYDPSGRVVSVRDENHAVPNTAYSYDPADRLVEVVQTLASDPGGKAVTRYGHDVHGNLSSVTDPNGNTTTYVYDDFGQLLRQISPATGTTTYTYGLGGELLTVTDANGAVTTRTFDVLGRLLTARAVRQGTTEESSYEYDVAPFGVGRVASMTDPTGTTSHAYERRGLLLSESRTIEDALYHTRFAYDGDGNRTRIVYPSGRVVETAYDYAGRPASMTAGDQPVVVNATYLPFGPLSQIAFGNGTTRTMTYDNRYRPLTNVLSGPSGPIASYGYGYDAGGNVTRIDDALNASYNRTFGYDDLGRLVTANTGAALWGSGTYSYDPMGNMLTSVLGSRSKLFTYDGTTPRLVAVTENGVPRAVTYDAAGNERTVGSELFDYTPGNRLAAGESSTYVYDARGIRTVAVHPAELAGVTVAPASVYPGQSAVGTVTLDQPAGAGGAVVTLASSDVAAIVPAEVQVAAGEMQATFEIALPPAASPGPVTITATHRTTRTATLSVVAGPALAASTLAPSSIKGGQDATLTIELAAVAPPGGARIALSAASAVVSVPATAQVAAGELSAMVTVSTTPVASMTSVVITASYGTSTAAATLELLPLAISAIEIVPASVMGGQPAQALVTLDGPAPSGGAAVALASSDDAVGSVPPSVVIPAGQTTGSFMVTTSAQASPVEVTITASLAGTARTASLTVTQCIPALAPFPAIPAGETVWIDDELPSGASLAGAMVWDPSQYASGNASLAHAYAGSGPYSSSITALNQPVHIGESSVVYFRVNECAVPREIKMTWYSTAGESRNAYWGEPLLGGETIFMGPVPSGGEWVRAEIPFSELWMEERTIARIALSHHSGQVWFDRIGKAGTACVEATEPPPAIPPGETVWVDDALPAGVSISGPLSWDVSQHASGSKALFHTYAGSGPYSSSLTALDRPVHIGESAVVYFRVNECAVPREIKITWDTTSGERASAFWGERLLGGEGIDMGPVPASGEWVRVEIPFFQLAMEERTIAKIDLSHHSGQVWFDRIGTGGTACVEATEPPPVISGNETVWVDDSLSGGVSITGPLAWDTSQHASGSASLFHAYAGSGPYSSALTAVDRAVHIGESAVVYFRVNQCAVPREIKITWYSTRGEWTSAYWGEPLLGGEGMSRGPVPVTGDWVKVELPFSQLLMEERTIARIDLAHHSGQVWFDRIGTGGTPCVETTEPPPAIPAGETIWVDDALPSGASLSGHATWDESQYASGNGSLAHPYEGAGRQGTFIMDLNEPIAADDGAVVYFRVSECALPREIKITWYATDGFWKSAYWGEALLGGEGLLRGAVPTTGDWVRVEIPFADLDLDGKTLSRIAIEHHSGRVWFDRIGKVSPVTPAVLTGLTASHASPQPAGTSITWTATASGSVMPLEYQFERQDGGVWSVVQAYGTASTYTWTPATADVGDHAIRVSVRNGGSLASFEDTATLAMVITESGGALQKEPANFLLALLSHARVTFRSGADRPPISMAVSTRLVDPGVVASTHYLYTPELNLMAEARSVNGQATIDHEYLWFAGQPVAQFETHTPSVHYYFNDHLGAPILTTDATGAVDWRIERDPYGDIAQTRAGIARHQPLSLPGQEQRGSEVRYNIFRWYRAGWGRYTQADPLLNRGFARLLQMFVEDAPSVSFDRVDWYGYAADNPLFNIDPLGLKVKNNTECRIYVKPENGTTPVPVYPGGEYPGKQDGYADPCKFPNQVFKTLNDVDVTVDSEHDPDTNGGPMQWFLGGWKDKDWQKKLHKKKDHGWDELFKKSDPGKCLCCAQ